MKINLTDGRVRERIKVVLLASEGWTAQMIAQALRIHETTVSRTRLNIIGCTELATD